MSVVARPEPTDVIILSVVVMAGSTIIRHIKEKPKDVGKGYAAPIIYGFLLVIALLVLAVPFPAFAKGLAYLGLIGAFAVNGPAIYSLAAKAGQ
jgi:hypothetical protein